MKSLLLSLAFLKWADGNIIWTNPEPGYNACGKVTKVFGVTVCVTANAYSQNRVKCDHVANVFYQLLDNDADGTPDDAAVLAEMVNKKYLLFVPNTDVESEPSDDPWPDSENRIYQMTGIFEAVLNSCDVPANRGASNIDRTTWPGARDSNNKGCSNERDATTEEILHLITTAAGNVYPDLWKPNWSSKSSLALQAANGDCGNGYTGDWKDPSSNQCSGQYAYDDATCDANCLIVEGIYWASVSYIGGLYTKRSTTDISSEWLMATPDSSMALEPSDVNNARSLQAGSPALYALVSETKALGHAWLPEIMPDGKYEAFDGPSPINPPNNSPTNPTNPPNNPPTSPPNNPPTNQPNNPPTLPGDGCNPACRGGKFCNFDSESSNCEQCPREESCIDMALPDLGEADCVRRCGGEDPEESEDSEESEDEDEEESEDEDEEESEDEDEEESEDEDEEESEDEEEQECVDSPLPFEISGRETDCESIADQNEEKKEAMCSGQGDKVAKHCPAACEQCEMFGCSDSRVHFRFGRSNKWKHCRLFEDKPEKCDGPGGMETCRETCGFCDDSERN